MRTVPVLAAALLAGLALPAQARIFHSKESALRLAFPGADDVRPLHLFLDDDHVREIERLSQSKVPSRLITVYVGKRQGALLGFAVIDTHVVRTLPETFLVVLNPQGQVSAVHILAFHEPQEYLPPEGWLQQFRDKRLSRSLVVRHEIAGIAGATLSAYAITAGVRKILALYEVVLRPHLPRAAAKPGTGKRKPG